MIHTLCNVNSTEDKTIPGAIVSIEQTKAFDRVDLDFMFQLLQSLNFVPYFNQSKCYTTTFHKYAFSRHLTAHIYSARGMRQGCPHLMDLYITIDETLECAITTNRDVHGIAVSNTEIKLTQHADNITIVIQYTKLVTHIEKML